ncbi:multiple epidermal growth factor-like domains protein 8 [Dermacentor silvarum]|uniref:multiple epidermal growth factor-like domains protein 8 n=1 Tax=Dermacentor silvarum TaxID=543639 RepID=UPI001896DFD1|nr:multiple epidermal growth factor-like domains protein 8 [Dermacentor silvarum]
MAIWLLLPSGAGSLLVPLLLACCLPGPVAAKPSDTCNRHRKILTAPWGIITDGNDSYRNDSHCEWLIRANSSKLYITLRFHEMATECAYDHVFVYDGDSYTSPLLGTFSGESIPPPVTATSGSMLILLYSDTNYVLKGFVAEYSITQCPSNCSGHGSCGRESCVCDLTWAGPDCGTPVCPSSCHADQSQGNCSFPCATTSSPGSTETPQCCRCSHGFAGISCSLPENPNDSAAGWHLLSRGNVPFVARAGHAGVYLPFTDQFFVFGGRAFGRVLGDFLVYNFNESTWHDLTIVKPRPAARWGHAMAPYAHTIALHGGELANGSLSSELWLYNVAKREWTLELPSPAGQYPPAVALHTLTPGDGNHLYVFGGRTAGGVFSDALYRVNPRNGTQWERVSYVGSVPPSVGHAAVFHAESRSLLVHGGVVVDYARFSKLSSALWAFHVDANRWTRLQRTPLGGEAPTERAFHAAALVGGYMVLFGGYMHKHSFEEKCFDDGIYLYHLRCHKWVSFKLVAGDLLGHGHGDRCPGVYSHVMALRRGHTLLVLGGYRGVMSSDLWAFLLPTTITHAYSDSASGACIRHRFETACQANPACAWCGGSGVCLDRRKVKDCRSGNFRPGSCPGLCAALGDCQSCMIWGGHNSMPVGSNELRGLTAKATFPQACGWCVEASACHPIHEPPGVCRPPHDGRLSAEQAGFWGPHGQIVASLHECRTFDFRPGLFLLQYRNPVNLSQPDQVSYVNNSSQHLMFTSEYQDEQEGGGEHVARLLGFLHPRGALPPSGEPLRLFLDINGGRAALRLGQAGSTRLEDTELVAQLSAHSYNRTEAKRPSGQPLLLPSTAARELRYLLDLSLHAPAKYCTKHCDRNLDLRWNARDSHQVISSKHLEPYRNGTQCPSRGTCLACLSDAGCGWCPSAPACVPRQPTSPPTAKGAAPCAPGSTQLLVLEPHHCPTCSGFIYCHDCVQDPFCEWIVEGAFCVRRGRHSSAVRHPDLCPTPCHLRRGCISCLGDPGRCAWCRETQSCFLFSTYTTSFMYGGCREWVDEDHGSPKGATFPGAQCPNCSAFKDCAGCLQKLGCGWCGNDYNPNNGVCVEGDFSGPYLGTCSERVRKQFPSLGGPREASWSYAQCPNVNECKLKLARCHPDATCYDTAHSYRCQCNRGFKGDGTMTCVKTCAEHCAHGHCSEAPDFRCICHLGWTGPRCDVDCGCHNHSSCERGVGLCDSCHNLTEGDHCHLCRKGSFGNATSPFGCRKCACNKHGDATRGTCDSSTGDCYCLHNTHGKHCESCQPGYFGDPRNGGRCYIDCSPKRVVYVEPDGGGLGVPEMEGPVEARHCLWILTSTPTNRSNTLSMQPGATLELTLLPNLRVPCPENHIYVYSGVPPFVLSAVRGSEESVLLGAFCGTNLTANITLVSPTGWLSVYFRRGRLPQGFSASFRRLDCPSACMFEQQHHCSHSGECVCGRGYVGSHCQVASCPNECSASQHHGLCEKGYRLCHCGDQYGGADCGHALVPGQVSWSLLFELERLTGQVQGGSIGGATELPHSRLGHSLLSLEPNQLWLFGGMDPARGDSDELYVYDLDFDRWKKLNVSRDMGQAPTARRFHGAAMVAGSMYIFGGLNATGVLGDFWKFATDFYTWTRVPTTPDVPALAGLTLTNVDNQQLVLIGGFSPEYGFQDKTLAYSIDAMDWRVLNTTGTVPIGVYGHTSNYHRPTQSIYVFGGIVYSVDRPLVSDHLYVLHMPSRRWSRLPPDDRANPAYSRISPRYFHASASTENSLFILGGRNGSGEAILEPFAYDFSCNHWIPLDGPYVQLVGEQPAALVGASATLLQGKLYILGGTSVRLQRVTLPRDLCALFSHSRLGCLRSVGCSYCSVQDAQGNITHCYSSARAVPASCIHHRGGTLEVAQGKVCDADWLGNRTCYQYNNCEDCVASWPAHPSVQHTCQWCTGCRKGRCFRAGESSCEKPIGCDGPRHPLVSDPAQCPLRSCLASECEKCRDLGSCMWTRQVVRSSELGHTVNVRPIFDWTCVGRTLKDASSFPVESNPPRPCPKRCSQHTSCTECLASAGGEGGWHECRWSSALAECMTPSYVGLRCEGGACGQVLGGSVEACGVPCHVHGQAAHCLRDPRCGWCGLRAPGANGRGLCMRGGHRGPTGGSCGPASVFLHGHPLPANVSHWLQTLGSEVYWYYFVRPPENECTNGHHTCDAEREECVDTPDGFECICKQGYAISSNSTSAVTGGSAGSPMCEPVCPEGCDQGQCVRPNECKCSFGYVGRNCSILCHCNGHSDCAGPDHLDVCTKCHNHTKGPQCSHCEPFYVGNPAKGGRCVPCLEYCNQHTNICVEAGQLDFNESAGNLSPAEFLESFKQIEHGPLELAVCRFCQNNTMGAQCEECVEGYFVVGKDIARGCRPCECHGHGDTCDRRTGENCNCKNNTENDRQCSQKSGKNSASPCWNLQCSKCKENFQGVPTNGHQCYRHMRLEQDYCLDPETQECSPDPNLLPQGRTMFFVVQPRYMNVDIRVIMDITSGAADLYLSAKEDTFVVEVNRTTGTHVVSVDRKYGVGLTGDFTANAAVPAAASLRNGTDAPWLLRPRHATPAGLATYVTVRDPREFLLVHNLQHRLVVTVPQNVYDLRSTRLYLVISGASEVPTRGSLFFRQDQTRIDLFVFFSVFFSCFFLFLAACVVVWKVKRAFDIRRARRLHAAQMEHMARRPFAKVCLSILDEEESGDSFRSPLRKKPQRRTLRDSPKGVPAPCGSVRPVAVEPTGDGAAAVTTLMVQLPGGLSAPVRLALASALVAVRSGGGGAAGGIRAAMRRRTSHINL